MCVCASRETSDVLGSCRSFDEPSGWVFLSKPPELGIFEGIMERREGEVDEA